MLQVGERHGLVEVTTGLPGTSLKKGHLCPTFQHGGHREWELVLLIVPLNLGTSAS